jgi:hypothetical protein
MVPDFGTKKTDGANGTAREGAINAMLPFARQRAFAVTENSDTTEIQAHTPFVIQTGGATLTLGAGGFPGCKVRVFNLSGGAAAVVWGQGVKDNAALDDGRDVKLEWTGAAWRNVSAIPLPEGWGAYNEGRDLSEVLGFGNPMDTVSLLVSKLNNGADAANGEPDFENIGAQIGDRIPGIDLSAIAAEQGGDAGQVYDATYQNNDIVIAGFNTYLGVGDMGNGNAKNHILMNFKNIPLRKKMNSADVNAGGYAASDLRVFLEGSAGDGAGGKDGITAAAFMNALKTQIGDRLYTIRKAHSIKSNPAWNSYTVFPPSELEVFGYPTYGDEGVYLVADTATAGVARSAWNTNVQLPLFAKSFKHRIKKYNGARMWWWESAPAGFSAARFALVHNHGDAGHDNASAIGGCAPAFCVA